MRKSITTIVSNFEEQLFKIQNLANLIEKKDINTVLSFRNWLFETEEMLKKFNLPFGSKFSVKRSELSTFLPKEKRTKKKEFYNFAGLLLSSSQEDLWEIFSSYYQKLESTKNQIEQLLNIVYQSNVFQFKGTENYTSFIENIWSFCTGQEQLKGVTIQILSQVNKSDVLIIIGELIDLEKLNSYYNSEL